MKWLVVLLVVVAPSPASAERWESTYRTPTTRCGAALDLQLAALERASAVARRISATSYGIDSCRLTSSRRMVVSLRFVGVPDGADGITGFEGRHTAYYRAVVQRAPMRVRVPFLDA